MLLEWFNFDNREDAVEGKKFETRSGSPLAVLRVGETRPSEHYVDALVTEDDMEGNEKGTTYLVVINQDEQTTAVVLHTGRRTPSGGYEMWDGTELLDVRIDQLRYPEPHVLLPPSGVDRWVDCAYESLSVSA